MKNILFLTFVLFVSTEVFAECVGPYTITDVSTGIVTRYPPCPTTNCPVGMILGDDGKCYGCGEQKDIVVSCIGEDKVLGTCPNRILLRTCVPVSKLCPKNDCIKGTFMGDDGKCYGCDEDKNIPVSCLGVKELRERCPNRGISAYGDFLDTYLCKDEDEDGDCGKYIEVIRL